MTRPQRIQRCAPSRRVVLSTLAVASLTLSGCGFQGLYSEPLPGGADLGNHPFTVTAHFQDVLDLVPQSAVKVNDVAVGKVTAISLDGWTAKVTMEVNDSVVLPPNARAEVAQTSLLGEKYVSLDQPLSKPEPGRLGNHDDIPISDTQSAAEVEDVLGALSLLLNEGGVEQIQVIARELNKALKGNEGAIRDLIGQLNTFIGTLDNQKTKITTALDRLNTLVATLNRQKTVLTDALDTYPAALKVLSDERTKLVGLLSSLSHLGTVASGVINATQSDLVSSLKSLTAPVDQLTAAGRDLPQSLRILGTFPFPLGTARQFVRGDYANLAAKFNLDLSDELCGVAGSLPAPLKTTLCTVAAAGSSASSKKLGSSASKASSSSNGSATQLAPMIIGAGK